MKLKKKIGALILCAMIAGTMTVSMTACGSSSTTSTAASSSSAINNNAALQTYLNDNPEFVETMKSSFASAGGDYGTCDILAEDGNLVLKITYNQQVNVTADALKTMETTADASKETLTAMVTALRDTTGLDSVKVVLRYINQDGSDILTVTATDTGLSYTEGKTN